MFKKKESTRLGEILVSKGLITPEQLAIATHEQTKRNRLLNVTDAKAPRGVMIGEILVEFGFIDQLELKRGLNWQQRLRHVSIAMALCAPFMVFAPTGASAQTTSSSSSSSTSATRGFTPTTIQAENYSSMNGIQNETTTDIGGGSNAGYIDTNDWMSYANSSVYVPTAGNYKVTFRVASLSGGGSLALKEVSNDATLDTFTIPKTGGWQTWVDVVRTVYLTPGTHTFKLFAVAGGFNVNWFKFDLAPTPMPLTIQTENYSAMSGVINETTTDTGGGSNTAYIEALDWMAYNNVDVVIPTTASYKITYRVASFPGGGQFTLNEASTSAVLDTISVPKTGGWQTWVNVERTLTLTAGKHNFLIKAIVGGFNINWLKIEPVIPTTSTSSQASVISSSSSSKAPTTVTSSAPSVSSTSSKGASVSSAPVTSSTSSAKSSTTSVPTSSAPSSLSSSKASSSASARVSGPVGLSWTAPNLRENGNYLDITELGGYEIRYRLASATTFTYINIKDPWTNQYNFSWLEGDYIFQIAAFDKDGNYSSFADIHPK